MLASIRGTTISYHDEGEGPSILWIHGFPLSSELFTWQFAIPGHRHIAPDLRGFGGSLPPGGPMTMETYAGDLLALLDHMEIARCTVAGVSMGGYIAFELLRQAPHRVNALLLCDTRELPDSEEGKEGRRKSIAAVQQAGSTAPVVDSMFPKMLTAETIGSAARPAELLRQIMGTASVDGVIAALDAMAARGDSTETLRACTLPALILVGDEDTITPPADASRMARLLERGEVCVIDRAAHLSNLERPDGFNRAVSRFLAAQAGRIAAGDQA